MKFGHMFKAIIICIPPYEDKGLFEYMDKEILKPQEMTKELDMKYMADNMAKRINQESDNDEKREKLKSKMATMDDDEKLKVIIRSPEAIDAEEEEAKEALQERR